MIYAVHWGSLLTFLVIVALTLGLSFWMGSRARTASGFFAAGGGIHWFVNGVAFAGDYLSAASFLGICGMIAGYGYDGFLYSIGYLAGWVVALFVIAEPLKRWGRFTFADALNHRFQSPAVQFAAALSTLIVSVFYLIPQMVGAGVLIQPLLGLPHWLGVVLVGAVVILVVVSAGMVSTTWVQFLKGLLLVAFSAIMVVLILVRGFERVSPDDAVRQPLVPQTLTVRADGSRWVNGVRQGTGPEEGDLRPVGHLIHLPGGIARTGPLGPARFLEVLRDSQVVLWSATTTRRDGETEIVYQPRIVSGADVLSPGNLPALAGLKSGQLNDRLNFLSLMLALFCGTASLPHILIRYYTVPDQASARKSTIVGIVSIGAFYIMTLFMGLGAMTSGALDVTNSNMAAPLLAKSLGGWLFAIISAIAFTTVLGTVSGLIIAASGAVVHDLVHVVARVPLGEAQQVRWAKAAAVATGAVAVVLGILFARMNVNFLVGWAFSIAASANLPSLVMSLFWRGTTRQGIVAAVLVGAASSLTWILLSGDTFRDVYGIAGPGWVPFSQPGLVTIPLGFLTLVVVSWLTSQGAATSSAAANVR